MRSFKLYTMINVDTTIYWKIVLAQITYAGSPGSHRKLMEDFEVKFGLSKVKVLVPI